MIKSDDEMSVEDFLLYSKEKFNVDISVVNSENPDTFESIFTTNVCIKKKGGHDEMLQMSDDKRRV